MSATPNPNSFMHSLGIGGKAIILKEEGGNLTHKFASDAIYAVGQAVKLASDGTVTAVTSVSDKPIGIVRTSETFNGDYFVTVFTGFNIILRGECTAAITAGASVSAGAFNATTKLQEYTTTVVGKDAVGVALTSTTTDGDELLVGILFNPALPVA